MDFGLTQEQNDLRRCCLDLAAELPGIATDDVLPPMKPA